MKNRVDSLKVYCGCKYCGRARWYDPVIGRFSGVDPIADKIPNLTNYNYASDNPITNIDIFGLQGVNSNDKRSFFEKIEDDGLLPTIASYFNINSFTNGSEGDKAQSVSRILAVSDGAVEMSYDAAELTFEGVKDGADIVGGAAATVTFVSGGTTAPVTGPIIAGATMVGGAAYGGALYVDVKRDGKLDTPFSEVLTETLFLGVGYGGGKAVSKGLNLKTVNPTHADQTESAVESIWSILTNLFQEASGQENRNTSSKSP